MDNFNDQSSPYVNSEGHNPQRQRTDNRFPNASNVNGINAAAANQHAGPYGQNWGYPQHPTIAQNASHPGWTNTAPQRNSINNDEFNQGNGMNAQLTTDPSALYNNNTYGAGDRLGLGQSHFNSSGVSPANLSNHDRSTMLSNSPSAPVQPNTISPEALQSRPTGTTSNAQHGQQNSRIPSTSKPESLPKGLASGGFLVTSVDSLKQVASVRPLHRYLDVATESIDLPISGLNIPAYVPRKSRNQIKHMLRSNQGYTATISKKLATGSGSTKSVSVPTYVNASGKLSTKPGKSEQSTPDDSSEESEYESSDDEPEKPPFPSARPINPQAAVRYDAMKALWRPSGEVVSSDSIRDGLKRFWEVLQTIRDRWKSDVANVAEAEKAKKEHEVPLLKERVKTQRDLLEVALKAAIQHGHTDVLDNFGQVTPAMSAFAFLLQDRGKENDYSGTFSQAILQFIVRCTSLDTANLEKSSLKRMLERFSKRGDDDIKALTRRITNNATAATKKAKQAKTVTSTTTAAAKPNLDATRKASAASSAGSKRPFAGEADAGQPAKKVVAAGDSAGKVGQPLKAGVTPSGSKAGTTAATVKQRTNSIAAKPSSFVASLQAAKKPLAPTAKTAAPKPAPSVKVAEQPPPFSFASVLADVANPKESKPVEKKQDERFSKETPEERRKRVRKEARRKLRVSFKPESSLVEVRYFTHDPDEDLGHDASQTRDVGDSRSEGKMLKMQSQLMEIDEEDEGESAVGAFSREWRDPVLVDFSNVDDDAKANNYTPYGGGMAVPDCPEKAFQEDREASVLAVFYSDPSEIPMNPKEPPADVMDDAPEQMVFGEPPESVMKRIEELKKRPAAAALTSVTPDLNAILSMVQNNSPFNQQLQQPTAAAPMSRGMPQMAPAFPQPGQMLPQQAKYGFPPNANSSVPNVDAIMSAMNQERPPSFPQASNPNHAPPPGSGASQDLNSILAALNPSLLQQPNAALQTGMLSNMPFMQTPNQMPHMGQQNSAQMMGGVGGHDQSSGGPPYENEERRRWRTQNGGDNDNVNGFEPLTKPHKNKDGGNLPFRVRPCTYWLAGKCNKGDRCTFLHSNPD